MLQVLEPTALLSLLVNYFVIELWEPSAETHCVIVFNLLASYVIEFRKPSAGTHIVTVFAFTYTILYTYILLNFIQNLVGFNINI